MLFFLWQSIVFFKRCEVKIDDSQIDFSETDKQPDHFDKSLFFASVVVHKNYVQAIKPNNLLDCYRDLVG